MLVVAVVPLSWGCKSESNCLFSSLSLFFFFFLLFISSFDVLHELTLHEVTTPPPLLVQARCGFIVALVLKSNVRGFLLLFMRRVDRAPSYIYIFVYCYYCCLFTLIFFFLAGNSKAPSSPSHSLAEGMYRHTTVFSSFLRLSFSSFLFTLSSISFFFFQVLLSLFFFFLRQSISIFFSPLPSSFASNISVLVRLFFFPKSHVCVRRSLPQDDTRGRGEAVDAYPAI